MLINALLNCIDFQCGNQEWNNAPLSFAKLHRLLLWNSRMKQCSSKLFLNWILLLWNWRIKQCTSKFCWIAKTTSIMELKNETMLIKALLKFHKGNFYSGTQELNNVHQSFAKLRRLLLLWNSRIKQCSSKLL